ncbi:hypothetical protein EFE40_07860 [Methanohalophilus halophilus]|uniref:Uncharacterized protein n=1 Tax=Methanohalophilus halophilus TaxID=2177 RepID=A0A3M9L5Y1_9EURY|nr:hypothetical protein EFE40_07860 [Methanohalophilus halophilus]
MKPRFLINSLKTQLFFIANKADYDSLFITTKRYLSESGRYNDYFFGPYFSLFSKPLIFESSFQGQTRQPWEKEEKYLFDFVVLSSAVKAMIKLQLKQSKYKKEIAEFTSLVCQSFSIPDYYLKLYKLLNRRFHSTKYIKSYTNKISDRLDGKIAFIHCASNHPTHGEIIKSLKENGITTVELQHGYVGTEHPAYNNPAGDAQLIAKEYLPDYFLTFGKYWNEQIQTPSKVVTVGNPSFNSSRDYYEKNCTVDPNSILIISQGTATPRMVKIATYLSEVFPERTIIFKLHPGEVPFRERYEQLDQFENIVIKTYDYIHELIASTKIIVGYYSTTLFEAMAYSNKRIFVLQNDLIPDSIGYKFSACDELRDAILNPKLGYSTADSSYFWEPDWESRIAEFLGGLSQK